MCCRNLKEDSHDPTNLQARALIGKVYRAGVAVTDAICTSGGKGLSSL